MKNTFLIGAFLFAATNAKAQTYRFDFGKGKVAAGYEQVLPSTNYSPERGYGFENSSEFIASEFAGKDELKDDYITSKKTILFFCKAA